MYSRFESIHARWLTLTSISVLNISVYLGDKDSLYSTVAFYHGQNSNSLQVSDPGLTSTNIITPRHEIRGTTELDAVRPSVCASVTRWVLFKSFISFYHYCNIAQGILVAVIGATEGRSHTICGI